MFSYIKGKVVSCNEGILILDKDGMGFLIKIPSSISYKENETVKVWVELSIKDETIKLYGFSDISQKEMFDKLQSISGIGPSLAMVILSTASPKELQKAILQENLSFFSKVKGVGPKIAKRIMLELKSSMQKFSSDELELNSAVSNKKSNAISGLIALGYPLAIATQAINNILSSNQDMEEEDLLKEALKII